MKETRVSLIVGTLLGGPLPDHIINAVVNQNHDSTKIEIVNDIVKIKSMIPIDDDSRLHVSVVLETFYNLVVGYDNKLNHLSLRLLISLHTDSEMGEWLSLDTHLIDMMYAMGVHVDISYAKL